MRIDNRYVYFLRRFLLSLLCFCALVILPACTQQPQEMSYETPREWTPVYNVHKHCAFVSRTFPVAFQEYMTDEDIVKILPKKQLPFAVNKAIVKFREDRSVYSVVLYIGSEESYTIVVLGDGVVMNYCCLFSNKGEDRSHCGDVEYTLYEFELLPEKTGLLAEAVLNDVAMCFRNNGTMSKRDFEAILECFSWYSTGNPNLDQIVPREH